MCTTVDVKSIQVTIRLGNVPQFTIAADERVTALPNEFRYRVKGTSDQRVGLLRSVLDKLEQAYPDSDSIEICVCNSRIADDGEC